MKTATKTSGQRIAESRRKIAEVVADLDELHNWISNWANDNGSAIDVYGTIKLWSKLKDIVEAGDKIKIVHGEYPRSINGRSVDDSFFRAQEQLEAKGWTLFHHEENGDSYELIYHHKSAIAKVAAIARRRLGRTQRTRQK